MSDRDEPQYRPMSRALLRPLTVWGIDRQLFFLALLLGGAVFNLFGSLLGGALIFGALVLAARLVTIHDPQLLAILLRAAALPRRLDAMKPPASRRQRP